MANEHLNLECPSCGRNGVGIFPQEGGRGTGDLTSYYARCGTGWAGRWKGGCGYWLGHLSADGTYRTALREWKEILNNAAEARRILGVDLMKQQELELNVGAFIGTTDWIDAGEQPPIHIGWYNTRVKMTDEERQLRSPLPQRRWWNGYEWSYPTIVGSDGEADCEIVKHLTASRAANTLEYQGLLKKVV